MTKTSSKGRRDIHIEGHGTPFVIMKGGAALAVGPLSTGQEIITETASVTGFVTASETISETVIVTVV